jgi:hypothetical protein
MVVARQLGHANPNITSTIYTHLLSDAELDRAARVFDPAPPGFGSAAAASMHERVMKAHA